MHWKWYKSDLQRIPRNGLKVFSCFSCGGGSSYGYKLAGYELIGNCEIDPKINAMYVKNHKPRYNFPMDIRDFNNLQDIPDELKALDILDGSPPCSTFSMAGDREKNWGREKAFREGQKKQILDDLFFEFLNTVERLRPKVVVAENVEGMVRGKAKYYVTMIIQRFKELGYDVQLFKLNSMFMGVPQSRIRVFFVANRMKYPKLRLDFKQRPITYKEIKEPRGKPIGKDTKAYALLKKRIPADKTLGDINMRLYNKLSCFNQAIVDDFTVMPTVTSSGEMYRPDGTRVTDGDYISASTFPQDYDFNGNPPQYVCGMSVPPLMMYGIANEIYKQWLKPEGE